MRPIRRPALCRGAVAVLFLLMAGPGCANLRDVRPEPVSDRVEVADASGRVSQPRARALIERMATASGARQILDRHLAFEQAANAGQPLVLGNRVTLLQNGPQTYEAMFRAIRDARHHICLETYIFDDDPVGHRFAELLGQRAEAGLRVYVIHDSIGTLNTPRAFFARLRERDVQLVEFNPVNPLADNARPWRLNNRDHRKLLVVDGRIAFVGGINITDSYSSSPSGSGSGESRDDREREDGGWRDTHLRIEGPVVARFQRLFAQTWQRQRGAPLDTASFYPKLDTQGSAAVRAIARHADHDTSPIYATLLSAIRHAEYQVHLTVAYFAPDPRLLDTLCEAAQRDVDVVMILPSRTDSWAVFHVGRSHYQRLLDCGVRIFERRGTVMHSKTASIDGVWSTIGSTNLDWRSFLHNDEVNAVVLDLDFAGQMDAMFRADLAQSDAIEPAQWRRRSLLLRLRELTARLGAYFL